MNEPGPVSTAVDELVPPTLPTTKQSSSFIMTSSFHDQLPATTKSSGGTQEDNLGEHNEETPTVIMSKIFIPASACGAVIVLTTVILVTIFVVCIKAHARIKSRKQRDAATVSEWGLSSGVALRVTTGPGTLLQDNDAYEHARGVLNVLKMDIQTHEMREDFTESFESQTNESYEEIDLDSDAHYERMSGMEIYQDAGGTDFPSGCVRQGTVMQRNAAYRQWSNNSTSASDLSPTLDKTADNCKDSQTEQDSKSRDSAYSTISEDYENCTLERKSEAYDTIDYRNVMKMSVNIAYVHSSPSHPYDKLAPKQERLNSETSEYQYDYAHTCSVPHTSRPHHV